MSTCLHNRLEGDVKVTRLAERGRFMAYISIRCAECKEVFRFTGAEQQAAPSLDRPTTVLDRTKLRVPIDPKGFLFLRGT